MAPQPATSMTVEYQNEQTRYLPSCMLETYAGCAIRVTDNNCKRPCRFDKEMLKELENDFSITKE